MIIAKQKPIQEIIDNIKDCKNILLAGCAGCVTVCLAGGEKETEALATALRIKRQKDHKPLKTITYIATRQCYPEFLTPMVDIAKNVDIIISLACGVGVQYLAEQFKDKWVIPAMNTQFIGGSSVHGEWEERCGLCGDCILHQTGGICPIIRCSKSILNGPCGGSQNGKCEVNKEIECAWQLIYERMNKLGQLDLLKQYRPPKDWSKARHGGPRKVNLWM